MKKISRFLLIGLILIIFNQYSNAQIVLQRCDIKTNWQSSNSLSIDNGDQKEGRGSLQCTGDETDWFKKVFSQTDVGVDETGYLSFWLYVSDVSVFDGDGQVEITSSGVADTDEYNWAVSTIGLINGWNHVKLALSNAGKTGTPTLNAIKYFRIP